jgi:hypothetical protein
LELAVPDDCDLTPLTKIASLKKVFVSDNRYNPDAEEGSKLIDKVRAILPNVEVTSDQH